jgi:hypothetical protein
MRRMGVAVRALHKLGVERLAVSADAGISPMFLLGFCALVGPLSMSRTDREVTISHR